MMRVKKIYLAFVFCMVGKMGISQQVAFNYESALLNQVSGFSGYADCALDMNADGLDDIIRIGNLGFYIDYQQLDGSFTQNFFLMPVQAPPEWSICAGDLDNNGYNDLLFASSHSVSFVKANDNGTAYQEMVMPDSIFCQRSTLADINNDGWLDGFVCNDKGQSLPFRNDGTGTMFLDSNLIHTSVLPGNYSAIWTDYDNDGDIDLYITKCLGGALPGNPSRTNLLYQNDGNSTFSEIGASTGLDDNAQSWSTVFEDFDNDGDFDAFIVNHDQGNRLFRNNGDGTFTNVIEGSGISVNDLGAWENASGDFNNDGFMDIFSQLQNELYLGNGELSFTGQDAPVRPGAIGDFNNDGFLDVLRNSQLWLNKGNENHWLKFLLIGIDGNRNGIGAKLEIYGTWGLQIREVRSGQSFSPMSSLTVHFGLGQNDLVDSLIVRWPSGIVTVLQNLAADSTYFIPEAACLLSSSAIFVENSSICLGDTTHLIAPSGFSNYLWSNNQVSQILSVSDRGTYFAILTDSSGCVSLTQSVEIDIIEDAPPSIFSEEGAIICQGDTLLLEGSHGENFYWSDGTTGTQTLEVYKSGIYTVATNALCTTEQLVSAPLNVVVLPSSMPVVKDVVISKGDSIILTAVGENCQWYDQAFGGNLVGVGSMFQTLPLSTSTSYFVESHHIYPSKVQQGGKLDTAGTGGLPLQGGYLLFEAWEPFTLKSVSVFVPDGVPLNPRFVQLISADTFLAVKQFAVQTGLNVLDLNFEVPVGMFSLQCPQDNLWHNFGQLQYPYLIGDVGQIVSSNFGQNFYYYFYDWNIKTRAFECVSERAIVNVAVTSTFEAEDKPILLVNPNPSGGIFRIELSPNITGTVIYRLLNASGQELQRQDIGNVHSFQLDLEAFCNGQYMLQIIGNGIFENCNLLKI